MFTSSQVSQMTRVAPSTLRKYVAQFKHHLSPGTQPRRGRKFTERDIATIQQIKELFSKGLTTDDVDAQLSSPQDDPEVEDTLSIIPSIGISLNKAHDTSQQAMDAVEHLENLTQQNQRQIESILLELKQLKAAVYRSKEEQDRLSKRIQEIENSSLWQRLSGRGKHSTGF